MLLDSSAQAVAQKQLLAEKESNGTILNRKERP
jgi:hypothetical protein